MGRFRPALSSTDRRILALALPALGALVIEPLYNLVDSAIVGHLGAAPLGGLAVATAALNVIGWAAGFLQMATVSAVAAKRSAERREEAARSAGAAYLAAGLLGLVALVLMELAAPGLASALGGHGDRAVRSAAVTYLDIAALGLPGLLVTLGGNGHLVGLADTRRPLRIALGANLANVALELLLVDVVHLGVAGSAWGTVAAQYLSAGWFLLAARRAAIVARWPGRQALAELARAAGPLSVRTMALGVVYLAATAVAGRLGVTRLGGHQIAMTLWNLLALGLDALAVPAQIFVSEALATDDRDAARRLGGRVLRLGLLAGVLAGIATIALALVIPPLFTTERAIQQQASLGLVCCGAQQPLAALAYVLDGLVLGAADYTRLRRAMVLALLGFAPLALATAASPELGLAGLWVALAMWLAARAGLLWRRWGELVGAAQLSGALAP
ncbi:MAG: MATE family efflux transporter [Actinomycetota bacterium]|nr:MATE family efflux transporter [Actinomycetota bacterium]